MHYAVKNNYGPVPPKPLTNVQKTAIRRVYYDAWANHVLSNLLCVHNDPEFINLVYEMAWDLNITPQDAASVLAPITRIIRDGAQIAIDTHIHVPK